MNSPIGDLIAILLGLVFLGGTVLAILMTVHEDAK